MTGRFLGTGVDEIGTIEGLLADRGVAIGVEHWLVWVIFNLKNEKNYNKLYSSMTVDFMVE